MKSKCTSECGTMLSACVCAAMGCFVFVYAGKAQIITQVLGQNLSYVRDAENIKQARMGDDWVEYYQR